MAARPCARSGDAPDETGERAVEDPQNQDKDAGDEQVDARGPLVGTGDHAHRGLVDADRVSISVDGAAYPRLKHLGADLGVSSFAAFLGAFQAFLGRWTGQEDVMSLVSIAARNQSDLRVVSDAETSANMGLKIGDDVIQQRFKYLWFGPKPQLQDIEPNEDTPLVT